MLCCLGCCFLPPAFVNNSANQEPITVNFFSPLSSLYYDKHEINNDFRFHSRAKYSFIRGKAQQGHEIPHSSELKR